MKTVSLVEALRSGKKFRYTLGNNVWFVPNNDQWSNYQILRAECQIIEEPREIWVWEYSATRNLCDTNWETKEDCVENSVARGGRPVKFREVCDE